ncbi:MAG: MBL fold metallo-hydrolase [Desulfobacteraceae bacterium]|nr:MAG: MBL fold metallo-hydrolase [Desulfobacteraceae bacterium]
MIRHDNWFDIRKIDSGVWMIHEPGHVQSFLVKGEEQSALIDTGMGFCDLKPVVDELVSTPIMVLNTHWHFDHIGGNASFDHIGISEVESDLLTRPLSNSELSAVYLDECINMGTPLPDRFIPASYTIQSPEPRFFIRDRDVYDLGGRTMTALATPGHTHGSISFLDDRTGCLFCGDLLYDGTLYAHFEDSDLNAYITSLEAVVGMTDQVKKLCVGHNQAILDPRFAGSVLAMFRKIESGALNGQTNNDWGTPVDHYLENGISILLKKKGHPGVRLFRQNQ